MPIMVSSADRIQKKRFEIVISRITTAVPLLAV